MIKKFRKLVTMTLAVILIIATILPITAQAKNLPDWFNSWADQIDGSAIFRLDRERYYEYMGLERVKDPSKPYLTFKTILGSVPDGNRKPTDMEITPYVIWDPYKLPENPNKWLQFRVYDDKGNLIIGSKRVKSRMNSFGYCTFCWSSYGHDQDLSYLKDGVYVIEWRCKYKDIKTKWEKVPVVTSTSVTVYNTNCYWHANKYAKAYDVYVSKESDPLEWIKVKTVKKTRFSLRKCKYFGHRIPHERYWLAVIPKVIYKGKPLPLRPSEAYNVLLEPDDFKKIRHS